jgi:hypothetical protein
MPGIIRIVNVCSSLQQFFYSLHIFHPACQHQQGIRISRVCASGTSKLAYDGSGKTIRNTDNHSICKFATGKVYNCDLSASYNIGARYYIREILKTLPAKVRSQVEAKVPQLARRTSCTLSTLINLNAVLNGIAL